MTMDNPTPLPPATCFRDYCLQDENRAQKILDTLLDPRQSLPETMQKHLTILQSYLSGTHSFEDFCTEVRRYNNSVLCGLVWTNATISYRCRTCAINPCMSLCPDCFHAGNHNGHDANMFRSVGGGVCDCGDSTVMNSNGFCKHHGSNRIPNEQIPSQLLQCTQIVLPRLMIRLIQHLRSHASPITLDRYQTIEELTSLTPLFDLFDHLCHTGSSIRLIVTDCLLNTEFYEQFNNQSSIDKLSDITHTIYLQQWNETMSLSIPISLQTDDLSMHFYTKKAICLLDEMLFWLVKFQIPERLLQLLLILLTDLNFKRLFIQSFLNIYGMTIQQLIDSRNSRGKMNHSRLVHLSVQLFSNSDLTILAIKEYHLLEIMLSSLYAIFSQIKTNCQLQNPKENYHLVISETDFSRTMHYWPMISDFINVLSHEYASMNVNVCDHESEFLSPSNTSYLFAFTAETECCAMTLWTVIAHIMNPVFLEITLNIINRLFSAAKEWLSAIGLRHYTDDSKTECCICRNKDDQNPLGLVVRLSDSGVLGVREVTFTSDNDLPLFVQNFNSKQSSKDPLTCCRLHSKSNEQQQSLSTDDQIILGRCKQKTDLTCALFYEVKIRTMLDIFNKESVSESMAVSWRTGVIMNSCNHSMHLSCYKHYSESHLKKSTSEIDSYIEFKCPMCRQKSNALIYTPRIDEQVELNENSIETITDLIAKNTKSCVSSIIAEWTTNFIQKIYLMTNKNYRTIDHQDREPTDDSTALFLVSTLRFNLENDLLVRDTEHIATIMMNRKSCFRELFYICNLKYPYLLNHSHISLWYRITGLTNMKLDLDKTLNTDKPIVPLLLSDPIVLLLRIMLTLPLSMTKESYRIIVQALYNLTYIQALFTIVSEMNKTEQEIWSSPPVKKSEHNMSNYLCLTAFKLFEANFNSNTTNSKIWSLESINASIRERCEHFIKIAALIQHHLYRPITWWVPGRSIQFEFLWKNLTKELQLYDIGEPYWFCKDSLTLINNWLDEVLIIDKQQSILQLAHSIPVFHPPRFIELPICYLDLFQSCTRLHCSFCRKLVTEPVLCLICGIVYPQERSEQKCCDQRTCFVKEHLRLCSGGLSISININSTKTLIQHEYRYSQWISLYLDEHGEEDLHLRRGRMLYLDKNRLKLLYSAWISSNLDQMINRWSTTHPFDF